MGTKEYTSEYKKEAVKLAKEVGAKQASLELDVPKGTLYGGIILKLVLTVRHP